MSANIIHPEVTTEGLDRPRDECGVFGVASPQDNVAQMTYLGLHALQHRGQESAGMAVSNGCNMKIHKGMGLVTQVFNEATIANLQGHYALGHTRYSTTGKSSISNAQPFQIETLHGPLAVAHNGNLVNAAALRKELLERGIGLTSTSDSEVMTLMLAGAPGAKWIDRIDHCMQLWIGAYALVVLTQNGLFAARDPWGIRPLTIGQLPDRGHAVASETGALETIRCNAIREIKPGEVISILEAALIVRQAVSPANPTALCTFEQIYFSRPDSIWDGNVIHDIRQRLGCQLAIEAPVDAEVVIPVPDSSIPAALGYSAESGIPYNIGLIKNRYIGRTFIQPSQNIRERSVDMKYNPLPTVLKDKSVVVIDDSIVRGTTIRHLVTILRDAGARQVHLRITCPPIRHPCHMGVDMATYDELIAHRSSIPEIQKILGADSLHYLSLKSMMKSIKPNSGYCNACFTGNYPFELNRHLSKGEFEVQNIVEV
ncbi:MAG: amidophosphoribosyltransferase [Chloroflexi bacterium]|nr:amidophosphoribosyltransferase [Chloroflexota bacterium]